MKKILITSIGRTGTTSLTTYLDRIPGVKCFHHKIGRRDVPYLFFSQIDSYSNLAKGYLENRNDDIASLDCDVYIEVNPYLRFANPVHLKELGWNKVFLVRNPKTYLQSVFVRETLSDNDHVLNQLPQNDDPFSPDWHKRTRFEKLCWYYGYFHEYVLSSGAPFYRFEEFTRDKEKLKSFVADIGLDVNKVDSFVLPRQNTSLKYKWKSKVKSVIRKNESYNLDALDWSSLEAHELKTYEDVCASLGKKLGY